MLLAKSLMLVSLLVPFCLVAASQGTAKARHRTRPVSHATKKVAGSKQKFSATAYSTHGKTSSGKVTTPNRTVAADPKVLPPGSHIQVSHAGVYSGVYSVQDQGTAVKGKKIDVYVPQKAEAKKFGRKEVEVKVLSKGPPVANK